MRMKLRRTVCQLAAAHKANNESGVQIARGDKSKINGGFMANSVTLAMSVQLPDPLRKKQSALVILLPFQKSLSQFLEGAILYQANPDSTWQ